MTSIRHTLLQLRYGGGLVLAGLLALNLLAARFHGRLDLTAEKRFTLSEPTREMVRALPDRVEVSILLEGDMPPGFQKLATSAEDMLEQLRSLAPDRLVYTSAKPAAGMPDSLKAYVYDSLQALGIHPTNVKAQTRKGEGSEETLVFPAAVLQYRGRTLGVDFLQGQEMSGLSSLNNAEALLEYRLADAIRRITEDSLRVIGYLTGNGEPLDLRVYDLIQNTLRPRYALRILPIDSVAYIPSSFSALCVVKPTQRFSEAQKLKLDQYVMRGGRIVWMLDHLFASLDSLQRSEGSFIAFDTGLELDDLLFRYGVRVNRDLVQDLQNDGVPSVIGNIGDKPQIQVLPWPYFPLLRHTGSHPIAKNLDYVVAQFPQSIDTVAAPGISKTILLSTSENARALQTPARVEWQSIRREEDLDDFRRSAIPVAVLLEGRFRSLFAHRLSAAVRDSMAQILRSPFLEEASREGAMVVVSDGDLAVNAVSQQEGPLPMGTNAYTRRAYANREFLLNSLEYLTDGSGILEARAKDYSLRLLDGERVEQERAFWQIMNLAGPMAIVTLLIACFQYWRRQRYSV
ncbi:MAG: gliding motility-associated ABC transporter substrate-binding protein GldG [Bacteroidetes bacterium]|nr:gliding motility-associated ABC transporter substrate-binding protein GldG [Bacteroidota bacterium]